MEWFDVAERRIGQQHHRGGTVRLGRGPILLDPERRLGYDGVAPQRAFGDGHVLDALCFAPFHAVLNMGVMILVMAQLDSTLTLLSLVIAPLMIGASFLAGKPLRAAAKSSHHVK